MSTVPPGGAHAWARPLRLLVIDDSPAELELLREALESIDAVVDVTTAMAGDEIELDQVAPWPDLVLLDVHLPRMNGIEVLHRLKADPVLRMVPVIMRSGSESPDDVTRAYVGQANAFIEKPRDFEGLVLQMRALLAFWAYNRTPSWRGGTP